jgi:hypothetical protein
MAMADDLILPKVCAVPEYCGRAYCEVTTHVLLVLNVMPIKGVEQSADSQHQLELFLCNNNAIPRQTSPAAPLKIGVTIL